MLADQYFTSVNRLVYRAIPDDPDNDPLDLSFAALSRANRWNRLGEATLYLASDPWVLATEWARHVADEIKNPAVAGQQKPRRIFEIRVNVDLVIDLRNSALAAELSLANHPFCFVESRDLCQETAAYLRKQTNAQPLIAPAIGLIDQPERWVLVVFTDKLPSYPEPFLTDIRPDGLLPKWFHWT